MFEKKYINNPEYNKQLIRYGKPISIRLNDEETKIVQEWQDLADIGSTSEAIKSLMVLGYNVIQGKPPVDAVSRLFKKNRDRLLD